MDIVDTATPLESVVKSTTKVPAHVKSGSCHVLSFKGPTFSELTIQSIIKHAEAKPLEGGLMSFHATCLWVPAAALYDGDCRVS